MAPTSKKLKQNAEPKPNAAVPPIATLVARLAREDVERLLVEAVEAGAVGLDRVLACLPEAQHSNVVPKQAPVTGGSSRTGTGVFDDVDDDLLSAILARLPARDRFTCAISVCKAWRGLCNATGLWRDIDIPYGFTPKGAPQFDGPGLLRLVSWLPNPAGVTRLALDSGDKPGSYHSSSIAPDAIKKALKQLPSLTSLSLSGKNVSAAVVASVTKLPFAANLTELTLDAQAVKQPAVVIDLFKKTDKLKSLTLSTHLATEQILAALAASLRAARGGGVPLLRDLHISRLTCSGCTWNTVAQLGAKFPELETLKVDELRDNGGLRVNHSCAHLISTYIARGEEFKLAPLARLKRLEIGRLSSMMSDHMNSAQLDAGLRALFLACPRLEVVSISHGHMSRGSKKHPIPQQPLPVATSSCLQGLPATVTDITLQEMVLAPDAFALCELPELKKLKLYG